MEKRTITIDGTDYRRVNGNEARNAYLKGETVILCPVNLNPASPWRPYVILQECQALRKKARWDSNVGYTTDRLCIDQQTGRYLAYYLPDN